MEWKHLFNSTILQRGLQYFRGDKVGNYREKDGVHCLTVLGTRAYAVRIWISGEKITRLGCNCPYAKEGHYCKHMAAALSYMEEQGLLEREELVPISQSPVLRGEDEAEKKAYSYFDCAAMKKALFLSRNEMEQMQKLLNQKAVTLTSVEFGYMDSGLYGNDYDGLIGTAVGVVQEKPNQTVSLQFDKNR